MSEDISGLGYGPDDMGDDEQEMEVGEYEEYIEDPPDDLVIAEDNDDDAEEATDWAATHPRAVAREEQEAEEPDDEPAEHSAIHEIPNT